MCRFSMQVSKVDKKFTKNWKKKHKTIITNNRLNQQLFLAPKQQGGWDNFSFSLMYIWKLISNGSSKAKEMLQAWARLLQHSVTSALVTIWLGCQVLVSSQVFIGWLVALVKLGASLDSFTTTWVLSVHSKPYSLKKKLLVILYLEKYGLYKINIWNQYI